jgi:hypothetical protein
VKNLKVAMNLKGTLTQLDYQLRKKKVIAGLEPV